MPCIGVADDDIILELHQLRIGFTRLCTETGEMGQRKGKIEGEGGRGTYDTCERGVIKIN